MSAHDPLTPPSGAVRWIPCTASAQAIATAQRGGDVEDRSSIYAAEGTFAHGIFADMCPSVGREQNAPALGVTGEVEGHTFTYDQDMHDHLAKCVEYIDALGPGPLLVEQRVKISLDIGDMDPYEIWGTADVILQPDHTPGVLHVADLKYGQGIQVDVENNYQMMLYAAGSVATHAFLFDDIHTVVMHVLQPRKNHFEAWSISLTELLDWVHETVRPSVQAIMGFAPAVYKPSKKACQWCDIAPCAEALAVVADGFEDISSVWTDDGKLRRGLDTPDPTPDMLATFLESLPLFELVAKQAREHAMSQLLVDSEAVPRFKIVEGRGPGRKYIDGKEGLVVIAVQDEGFDPYAEPAVLSPAKLEKVVGKAVYLESVAPHVESPKGRPTLAPESDKRQRMVMVATADDFEIEKEI